jgi:hypothetical protein
MKQYNVTAQIYSLFDPYKQTILFNDMIVAESSSDAIIVFNSIFGIDHKILKIYSVEEISQVVG